MIASLCGAALITRPVFMTVYAVMDMSTVKMDQTKVKNSAAFVPDHLDTRLKIETEQLISANTGTQEEPSALSHVTMKMIYVRIWRMRIVMKNIILLLVLLLCVLQSYLLVLSYLFINGRYERPRKYTFT